MNHRKIAVLGFLIATIAGLTIVSLGTADTSESGDTLSVSDNQSTNETLEGLAESFYNTDDVAVYEVQDSRFFDGFPNHDLYTVYELEQYPAETHTLAVSSADELRDVTEDYNVLLNDAGVLLDSSSDAQLYAEALAQTANPEDLPLRERQLVNASDSDRLNHSIEDPVVETQGTGWKVQLHTYSPENGYIAEWTVYTGLEEVTEANFQIEAVGNGPSETSIETAALSTDYKIYNDYDGETHSVEAYDMTTGEQLRLVNPGNLSWQDTTQQATAFDGSVWQAANESGATWTTDDARFAENLTAAGAWSHEWLVLQSSADCASEQNDRGWADQPDPDCRLELRVLPDDVIHCAACVEVRDDDQLIAYTHGAALEDWLLNEVEWDKAQLPTDTQNLTRLVVSRLHEVFLATQNNASLLPSADGPQEPNGSDRALEDEVDRRAVIGYNDSLPDGEPSYVDDHNGTVVMRNDAINFLVVDVNPDQREALKDDARDDQNVTYAENDTIATSKDSSHHPIDTLYQSGLQPGAEEIQLPEAWGVQQGDHEVDVFILDTGVAYDHLDLAPNLSPICNGDLGESFTGLRTFEGYESGFHGTHVTGIAAGVMDNVNGRAGTAQACVTPIRVLLVDRGLYSWVAAGITHAANQGADVISMSLGGSSGANVLQDAVEYADNTGSLIVSAAGNDYCGSVGYPAAYAESMAIAALDQDGETPADYSSCGPEIDVAAVGTSVLSSLPGNSYGPLSGTSMATPFVSGTAALMFSENPSLSNHEARCIIENTADDLAASSHEVGKGRVDAHEAVHAATDPSSVDC